MNITPKELNTGLDLAPLILTQTKLYAASRLGYGIPASAASISALAEALSLAIIEAYPPKDRNTVVAQILGGMSTRVEMGA